ncbi:type 1 glutamine amidotransferase [Lachnospiraceae bacterium LCP25S3_G4]
MYQLNICHLYADTLNLYGDQGNIRCMEKRLAWRGIQTTVTPISIGDALNIHDYDLFFIGGGQDYEQGLLIKDLSRGKGKAIKTAVEEEKVFIAICAGYQILGNYYKTWDGQEHEFIGALDTHTIGSKKRMIGNYMFTCDDLDRTIPIIGFENHSGRTFLGSKVRPLGSVLCGYGNNGIDHSAGARYKNVFGTYAHGPLLPKNPLLCDYILKTALQRKYPGISFDELNDTLELNAHEYMMGRLLRSNKKLLKRI